MTKNISIPALARVEGEGALYIRTKDNKIEEIELNKQLLDKQITY